MIRVIRVLEYTYPDMAAADLDMARWTRAHTVPSLAFSMRTVGELIGPQAVDTTEYDARRSFEEAKNEPIITHPTSDLFPTYDGLPPTQPKADRSSFYRGDHAPVTQLRRKIRDDPQA